MKLAVIILHYGKVETTKTCLKNLAKKIDDNTVILINNTSDDLRDLAKIIPGAQVMNNQKNVGFAVGVNQGIQLAFKDKSITHVFLMNNDVSLDSGSFNQLLLTCNKYPAAGIVSPVLHHGGLSRAESKEYDWGGKYNKWTGMVKHKNWQNKPKTILMVEHVAGAAMFISRAVIEKIGLFDERFFLYFEDLDFCLRAKEAGFTIHINPDVVAEHAVSAGSNTFARTLYQWISHLQFVTKHLFAKAMPTAYLFDIIFYPLCLLKSLLRPSRN